MKTPYRLPLILVTTLLALAVQFSPVHAYQIDTVNHLVTMSPGTSIAKTTVDLKNAMSFLVNRPDKVTPWTLKLNPGAYTLSSQVSTTGLQSTTITSTDFANPAKLIKMPGWDSATSAEYIMVFGLCKNIQLSGIEFYGQTDFKDSIEGYWPDQGVYFGSCNVVKVDQNKFYNFGNAALRVATWERDPVGGVNSFKTTVSGNLFDNIYQTSTTVQDNIHGGTAMSTWINNTFTRLRGSMKFASRTPGAATIELFNNTIDGGDHFGMEINNYSNFHIQGNTIKNIKSVAMNIYTGAIPGFPWGDNFTINNNTIDTVGRGIRFSHEPGSDGFQYVPSNLVIDNNTVSNVTDVPNVPAIWVVNGSVNNVTVTNNTLTGIANQKFISLPAGTSLLNCFGNMGEGLQTTPTLK